MGLFVSRSERERRQNELDLVKLLIGQQLLSKGKYTYGPGGKLMQLVEDPNQIEAPTVNGIPMKEDDPTPQMKLQNPTFEVGDQEDMFQMNKDTGKLEKVNVPGLKRKRQILDFNPPSSGADKETTEVKAARAVHEQYLKAIAGQADMTETLQKQMEAAAPILGLEKTISRGKEKTNWRGKPTGEREEGVTYYKPKGTITEDEWDEIAEGELKAVGAPITPANIAEAKRQLKTKRSGKK